MASTTRQSSRRRPLVGCSSAFRRCAEVGARFLTDEPSEAEQAQETLQGIADYLRQENPELEQFQAWNEAPDIYRTQYSHEVFSPANETKRADKRIDGRLYFRNERAASKVKQVILQVRTGHTGASHVQQLRSFRGNRRCPSASEDRGSRRTSKTRSNHSLAAPGALRTPGIHRGSGSTSTRPR